MNAFYKQSSLLRAVNDAEKRFYNADVRTIVLAKWVKGCFHSVAASKNFLHRLNTKNNSFIGNGTIFQLSRSGKVLFQKIAEFGTKNSLFICLLIAARKHSIHRR